MRPSVTKNYLYNVFYQVFTIVTPLITTPYVSRVLGPEGIGIFGYAQSISTYFVLFGALGSNLYGQREIAYVQDDKIRRSLVFKEIISLRILTVFFATLIYIICFCFHNENSIIFAILGVEVLASAFDISWFFMGIQDFKKSVLRNVLIKVLSLFLIFVLVKNPQDVPLYAACYAIPMLLSNLSLWFYLPKYLTKDKPKKVLSSKHLVPLLALFVPQVATEVYTVLDKTMLGILANGYDEVGFYEQSQKIIKVIVKIITALGLVMLPKISMFYAKGLYEDIKTNINRSFRFVFLLGFPMMFGIIAISDRLVPWFFGPGFNKVIPLLQIISPIIIIIGISNVIGKQYLLPTKQQKFYTISVVAGAVMNFILNLLLIPRFESFGASIATVIAELTVTVVQIIYVRQQFSFLSYCLSGVKYCMIALMMGIVVWLVGYNLPSTYITTILQGLIGIAVYGVVLLLIRDDFVILYLCKIKKKLFGGKNV